MTQQEIELFLTLVEKRNISKAASSLFLSQSTLSYRLSQLEAELKEPLFVRHKGQRSIELTPFGENFLPIAQQWMALLAQSENLHADVRPQYNLGTVASVSEYLFSPMFHQLYTDTADKFCLTVKVMQSAAMYPALEVRELDMGFAVLPSIYSNITNTALLEEENVLVVRSSNPSVYGCYGPDVHPKELDPQKEFMFQYHRDYSHWRDQWFGVSGRPSIALGDGPLLIEFFRHSSDNWSIVPVSVALALQNSCQVQMHHLVSPPPPRICYLLRHRMPRVGSAEVEETILEYIRDFLAREEELGHLTRISQL